MAQLLWTWVFSKLIKEGHSLVGSPLDISTIAMPFSKPLHTHQSQPLDPMYCSVGIPLNYNNIGTKQRPPNFHTRGKVTASTCPRNQLFNQIDPDHWPGSPVLTEGVAIDRFLPLGVWRGLCCCHGHSSMTLAGSCQDRSPSPLNHYSLQASQTLLKCELNYTLAQSPLHWDCVLL